MRIVLDTVAPGMYAASAKTRQEKETRAVRAHALADVKKDGAIAREEDISDNVKIGTLGEPDVLIKSVAAIVLHWTFVGVLGLALVRTQQNQQPDNY